jgi:hypothetical protein
MPKSRAPDRVPLTGADCFLRAFDLEVRRKSGASHLSQLVLRLGPGFDSSVLAKLIAEIAAAQPILRAPIRRPFGVLPPEFRLDLAAQAKLPRVEVHDAPRSLGEPPLPPLFAERLNGRLDGRRGELLRCDVVRYEGGAAGSDVAFTWLHMLLDGSGSERFVRWLDEVGQGARSAAELPDEPPTDSAAQTPPAGAARMRTAGARGEQALRWRTRMRSFASRAPRSLAGPLARTPQRLEVDLATFTREETARIGARARKLAGFLTPMLFYLAASVRAHRSVFQLRGIDPRSFVVPLPVNLRAKGAAGSLFGTRVSLLWFQVLPESCSGLEDLLAELKAQRLAAIKEGMVEAGSAAMDFARWLPRSAYARMARRSFGGELCSFFFAYTDEFLPGMTSFLGAPIHNAFHAPSVPPSPGSGAIFSLRDGRLNFSHVRQAGVFSGFELVRFRRSLRADLLGEAE